MSLQTPLAIVQWHNRQAVRLIDSVRANVTFREEQVRQLISHVTEEQQVVAGFEMLCSSRELGM